jgi:DNA repair photolyase
VVLTHSGHLHASSMALVRVLVLRTPDEADSCTSALEPLAPHLQERAHDVVRLSCRTLRACCWLYRPCIPIVCLCVCRTSWSLRVFEARLTARCYRCCGCANSL